MKRGRGGQIWITWRKRLVLGYIYPRVLPGRTSLPCPFPSANLPLTFPEEVAPVAEMAFNSGYNVFARQDVSCK